MKDKKALNTQAVNTWCPGCGNFGILSAMRSVLMEIQAQGTPLENVVLLSGIGCHAKIVDYVDVNSFYSLHGRVIPPLTGIKLVNPDLIVIGHAGDGDAYGEGIEHLIFAAKRNVDATFIVHNNSVYGLTTGQFTPTSPKGFKGRSTPDGSPEYPMNPLEIMLASGASFVARGYSGKIEHLKKLILQGIEHKGFSFIDVLQPCYTFFNTYEYYNKWVEEIEDATKERPRSFDEANAMIRSWPYDQSQQPIAIGIFYTEQRSTFEEEVLKRQVPGTDKIEGIQKILERMR
ncbi:2-oxoglutarate oxidoreductase, beta subunit [Dissulfuribacter thermophilus]|uniref:2-oxoglutarate oxidoreductase, beta subunit n=1 Tax=Dissulfuribacter thermophilus TaxID=1156395 RepID=A0A1B9F8G5_9BACT|nr:thiamine pyrophosphate-dependent enzyme [Dissulfuribacter thermophilus]OCC16144.1 2-oxoglutarate oxidoreductase, beta subunit [Dissulfuribacter thermophilus]